MVHAGSNPAITTKHIIMKISIEKPFDLEFKAAYLNTNKEPRKVVSLIRKDNTVIVHV